MKGIGIFHNKFSRTHHPKAGSDFVTKFGLHLIQSDRQLFIAVNFVANEIGYDFFVGGAEAEAVVMTIVDTK